MAKEQRILLYLYIFLTFFVGRCVRSWLHFEFSPTSIIGGTNYLGLPILIILYISLKKKALTKSEWVIIVSSIICVMIGKVLHGSAVVVNIVNNCFEPILLCCVLRSSDFRTLNNGRTLLIYFFIVECLVAIYEASTRTILFATLEDDKLLGMQLWDMRAYSLHGHPLSNGSIVSLVCLFFLTTNTIKKKQAVFLLILGVYALFCFNNRSSVFILAISSLVYLAYYIFKGSGGIIKKITIISSIAICGCFFLGQLSNSYIGSRIFSSAISKNDDSTQGHLAALYFLDMLDEKGWLFGVSSDLIYGQFMRRAQAVAVESSIILYILTYGLIYTTLYYYFLFKFILTFHASKIIKYLTAIMVILTLNASNLIFGACPYISLIVLCLYCFSSDETISNCTGLQRTNINAKSI